jgi:hypothetical protein
MTVYPYTKAQKNLAALLEQASQDGEVQHKARMASCLESSQCLKPILLSMWKVLMSVLAVMR